MDLPLVAPLRQTFAHQPEVEDIPQAVARAIRGSRLRSRLMPGARVAITGGSRGIAHIAAITRATAATLMDMGFEPFVVAAMGSHGSATANGQRAMLAELGITETSVGCPIVSEMETVVVGTNSFGLPIHFDRAALAADGIVLLNRIKPHTSFSGDYESGLLKMLVVGLGKHAGALQVHKLGLHGLRKLVPEVGAFLIKRSPVALGLAVLENAREQTARVVAVEPEDILRVEPQLLNEARALMARLPFDQIDVLIVGELGKNYSGTGLDPNVIGRQRVETMPDLPRPIVTRLAVLDLSRETKGNATGIGLADLTTERLVADVDHEPMRVNCFTSNFLTRARIPIALPTDHDVIATCLDTCWRIERSQARMLLIPNTLELETLWATAPLVDEARESTQVTIDGNFVPLPFDATGTLMQEPLFPKSVRGRRTTPARHEP